MAEVIRMPRLSDTMEEGVIVGWLKKVGDKVEPGDILAEVETDKATMELESFHEGFLLHIGVEEGAVPVDGVLAVIGEQGEDYQAALDAESSPSSNGQTEEETSAPETPEVVPPVAETPPEPVPATTDQQRIKASPLAKALASEAGISLSAVSGSGEHGRIIKRDIESFLTRGPASMPTPASVPSAPAVIEYGEFPISQMRKTIARRLSESKFGAPHFYLTMEIDMSQAVRDRKMINADAEIRVSFNDMVIKACALALQQHPAINSSWLGDKVRVNKDINIGVAVAVDEGLLVPVVKSAYAKNLRQIHMEVVDYAGRARDKKLQLEEMQGNTFTISNLGMFGIEEFTAIINPPDSCILAVGAIVEKPVVRDGQVVIANMMKVTLSCDHRVVDGATGSRFLQSVQQLLESPVRMLA